MEKDLKVVASLETQLPVGVIVYLMILNLLVIFITTVFFTITTNNNNNGRKLLVICVWNVSFWLLWPARSVFMILPRWAAWHYTHCVFVSFSRSRSQTAGRRWVWRVIPLHLSINLETISSVPLQNVKASLSRRWVHHLLSKTFPRVSIKNTWTYHVSLFSIALPSFSVNGGEWVNAVEWVVLYAVCKREPLCLKTTGCDRILFSVADITLYRLWWGMCQSSPV